MSEVSSAHGGAFGLDELRPRLLEAAGHEATALSARFLLDALASRSPFATSRRNLRPNDQNGTRSFPGWTPPDDPEPPARISPIPLEFELPIGDGTDAPLPDLAPWWDLIRIAPGAPVQPIAWLTGERSLTGPWVDRWPGRVQADGPDSAHLRLYERSVELQAWWKATTTSIKPSGFLSYVLIPGYGPLKDAASLLASGTLNGSFGCRLEHRWISAITTDFIHRRKPPIGSRNARRALFEERGYGELQSTVVGLEFSDGWLPYRATIETSALVPEEDAEAFVRSLVATVEADRRRLASPAPHLPPPPGPPAPPLRLETHSGTSTVTRTMRIDIPGAIPITAEVH